MNRYGYRRRQRRRGNNSRRNRTQTNIGYTVTNDVKVPAPISIPTMRTHRFVLRGTCPLLANSSGEVAAVIPFDPSATLSSTYLGGSVIFDEYKSLSVLYSELKVRKFEITIYSAYTDANFGSNQPSPLAICSNSGATYTNPGSYAAVMDNGDSQMYPIAFDNSGTGRFHSVTMRVAAYALTATPNPGSSTGISAGCPGHIALYAQNFQASVRVGQIRYVGEYIFRSRN